MKNPQTKPSPINPYRPLLGFVLLLCTAASEAQLIPGSEPGIVTDTIAQIDWLSPTVTVGRSYDDINSELDAGQFAGFRYAYPVELATLLEEAGLTVDGIPQPGESAAAQHILDLFGMTGTRTPSGAPMASVIWGMTASTIGGMQTTGGILMLLTDIPRIFCGCYIPPTIIGGLQDPSIPEGITGSWLVRPHISVPEPSSWALIGIGLALIATARPGQRKIALGNL